MSEAAEEAHEVRRQQVSGQTAIKLAEQLWNRDLSGYDPDGPLPEIDPDPGENTIARGRASVRMHRDPVAVARQWRERAAAGNLSMREVIIEMTGRQSFIGSAATIAESHSTSWSRPTPATASSWSRTSRRAAWTTSPTRSCRCCRSAASTAPSTRAPPCATTSASRRTPRPAPPRSPPAS